MPAVVDPGAHPKRTIPPRSCIWRCRSCLYSSAPLVAKALVPAAHSVSGGSPPQNSLKRDQGCAKGNSCFTCMRFSRFDTEPSCRHRRGTSASQGVSHHYWLRYLEREESSACPAGLVDMRSSGISDVSLL